MSVYCDDDAVVGNGLGRRVRVVLLAPYMNREDVGESWSAWQWARGLSERHEVTVLTTRRAGQAAIAPTLPMARVVEWEEAGLGRRFERLDSMLKPGFVAAYARARAWLKAARGRGERIDLVHQVAPLAMRYPCPAAGMGWPVVMGPVGGSLTAAPIGREDGARAPWFVRLRGLDRLRFRTDPWLRRSYEGAACVIGVAPYVRELLEDAGGMRLRRFEVASETGVSALPEVPMRRKAGTGDGTLRLLYVGRVIRTKGLRDAVRAVAMARGREVAVKLDAVGDGEDLLACREEAARLGVGGDVTFHGRRKRSELDDFYSRADAFIFPSFREPSGNVVLEAMSHGLAMIVSTVGGPGHVVKEHMGFRIEPRSADQFASQLADAVCALRNDDLRLQLGNAARREIEVRYVWGTKIAWMGSVYESIVYPTIRGPRRAARRLRLLAVASNGGHWTQLLRLRPAFAGHDVCFVSTHRGCGEQVSPERFRKVTDGNRRQPVRLLWSMVGVAWAVVRERPDVVVTTGAAPGLLALRLGRLMGAKTVWIDSIANAETLSLSGKLAEGRADLLLTQWPELAQDGGPGYLGGVL